MTQTNELSRVDTSTSQIEPGNGAMVAPPDPSIEQILYHAVDRGVDVATLERLVALKERVDAEKAEKALNAALREFRRTCPCILKTREVRNKSGDTMYRFANLEDVRRVIEPHLSARDLSYSWDAEFTDKIVVTTCTVRHSAGGKRSAKFASPTSGAPNMNAAQAAGSTTTYGQRYSLLAVLGLSADLDDDGRGANASPQPEHDASAPRAHPRGTEEGKRERAASHESTSAPPPPADPTKVTAGQLNELCVEWSAWAEKDTKEFAAWAKKTLGSDLAMDKVGHWNVDALEMCRKAMES